MLACSINNLVIHFVNSFAVRATFNILTLIRHGAVQDLRDVLSDAYWLHKEEVFFSKDETHLPVVDNHYDFSQDSSLPNVHLFNVKLKILSVLVNLVPKELPLRPYFRALLLKKMAGLGSHVVFKSAVDVLKYLLQLLVALWVVFPYLLQNYVVLVALFLYVLFQQGNLGVVS